MYKFQSHFFFPHLVLVFKFKSREIKATGNIEWKWNRRISKYVQKGEESFHLTFLRLKIQDLVSSPHEIQPAKDIQFKTETGRTSAENFVPLSFFYLEIDEKKESLKCKC